MIREAIPGTLEHDQWSAEQARKRAAREAQFTQRQIDLGMKRKSMGLYR